mmetsp:Transcript_100356/g.255342  ORF Transcript_100356/g.255342 Transcript_100356/m.255342 type:complete len:219 (-) Transcript_100356:394-1050(-)
MATMARMARLRPPAAAPRSCWTRPWISSRPWAVRCEGRTSGACPRSPVWIPHGSIRRIRTAQLPRHICCSTSCSAARRPVAGHFERPSCRRGPRTQTPGPGACLARPRRRPWRRRASRRARRTTSWGPSRSVGWQSLASPSARIATTRFWWPIALASCPRMLSLVKIPCLLRSSSPTSCTRNRSTWMRRRLGRPSWALLCWSSKTLRGGRPKARSARP